MKDGLAGLEFSNLINLDSIIKQEYSDIDDWDDCPEFAMKIYCGSCEGCPFSRYGH